MRRTVVALGLLALGAWGNQALADEITFGGAITQSTQQGTGPAVNNSSLNNIAYGDVYTVTLTFAGSIGSPGTYTAFTAVSFTDPASAASETSFDLTNITLAITSQGSNDELSVVACLTTGTLGCSAGNELTADFQVLATDLNASSVAAQSAGLASMDLLEDDGVTDIHGGISQYSYTASAPSTMPEPSSGVAIAILGLFLGLARMRHNRSRTTQPGIPG